MVQNKFLFSTTRIPGAEQDTVRAPYSADHPGPATARHVVVFHRGTPFRLDVVDADGRPYDREDLAAALQAIMKDGAFARRSRRPRPGTSPRRPARSGRPRGRTSLGAAPGNAAALEEIETALFCVCLDEDAPQGDLEACDQLLHGDSGNRWFDKSFSFVVFADGTAGINVEHCGLDGTTILSFVDTLLGGPLTRPAARGVPAVAPVELVIDDGLRRTARAAAESFDEYAQATASAIGVVRGLRVEPGQGARHVAGRLRADGLPARAPPREGPDRRHVRVDRHPPVPARPHRGDARGHAGGADVRVHDGRSGRVGGRPARGVRAPRPASTWRGRRSARRARRRSSTCGSCS